MWWAPELPELLQPQGDCAAEQEPDGARPREAGDALPAGERDDGERRAVDPAVLASEPADLEVGRARDEEQPVERRLHLERRRMEVEVGLSQIGPRLPSGGRGSAPL